MHIHPTFSVLFVTEGGVTQPLVDYLQTIQPVEVMTQPALPEDLSRYRVVVTSGALHDEAQARLGRYVEAGGSCLALTGLSEAPLPDFFGVQPGPVGPINELRVIFTDANHPMATRMTDAYYLAGRYHPLEVTADGVEDYPVCRLALYPSTNAHPSSHR